MALTNHNGSGPANAASPNASSTPSLGELFSKLANDTSTLVRQEVALAKAEVSQGVSRLVKGAMLLAVAGVFGLFAAFTLVAALVLFIGRAMDNYPAAALIVGVAFLVVAAIFGAVGASALKKANPKPTQTLETLREDAEYLKEKIKS